MKIIIAAWRCTEEKIAPVDSLQLEVWQLEGLIKLNKDCEAKLRSEFRKYNRILAVEFKERERLAKRTSLQLERHEHLLRI